MEESQEQTWDNIAKEWFEFKTKPAKHVEEFLKGKKGKILDLGSGAGRHLQKIGSSNKQTISQNNNKTCLGGRVGTTTISKQSTNKMYLVDFSKKMIKLAKKRAKEKNIDAEFVVSNLEKLPYENEFFDYAIAVASLHCLEPKKQKKAIKELFRVLKKGGQAEIAVWNKDSKPFKNAGKEKYVAWRDKGKRYYYLFDEKEIHDLFKKTGFKIISKEEPRRNIIFVVQKTSS